MISDGGLKSVRTWNPARVAAWISSSPGFLIPSPASPATRITSDPRCAGCTRCSVPPSVATPATCTIAVYLVVPQSALDRYVLPALRTLVSLTGVHRPVRPACPISPACPTHRRPALPAPPGAAGSRRCARAVAPSPAPRSRFRRDAPGAGAVRWARPRPAGGARSGRRPPPGGLGAPRSAPRPAHRIAQLEQALGGEAVGGPGDGDAGHHVPAVVAHGGPGGAQLRLVLLLGEGEAPGPDALQLAPDQADWSPSAP